MSDESTINFSRKLVKQFILKYKDQVCLWNKHAPSYKSKKDRHKAITELTKLVQSYDPAATRVHILRKIDSLRACVRREYRKVTESRQLARRESEVYAPQLWYYNLFSFLIELEEAENVAELPEVSPPSTPEPNVVEECSEEEAIESDGPTSDDIKLEPRCVTDSLDYPCLPSTSSRAGDEPKKKKKRGHDAAAVGDEYDAIGINVAAKLRNLPDNMRIMAEKLIGDVLFQAQTNGLSSASVLVTPDPFR